jgi:hypothetical protein
MARKQSKFLLALLNLRRADRLPPWRPAILISTKNQIRLSKYHVFPEYVSTFQSELKTYYTLFLFSLVFLERKHILLFYVLTDYTR